MEPRNPLRKRACTEFLDRNWLPRSEWAFVLTELLCATASSNVDTDDEAFIREGI
jgi:hypothetical protein